MVIKSSMRGGHSSQTHLKRQIVVRRDGRVFIPTNMHAKSSSAENEQCNLKTMLEIECEAAKRILTGVVRSAACSTTRSCLAPQTLSKRPSITLIVASHTSLLFDFQQHYISVPKIPMNRDTPQRRPAQRSSRIVSTHLPQLQLC